MWNFAKHVLPKQPWWQLSMILKTSVKICEDLSLGNISESPREHKYNELHMEHNKALGIHNLVRNFG
jgi:hypothetical protein